MTTCARLSSGSRGTATSTSQEHTSSASSLDAGDFIDQLLNTFRGNNITNRNISWKHKYEFYTPIDCYGFCYLGQSSSIRLLQPKIPINQLTANSPNSRLQYDKSTSSNGSQRQTAVRSKKKSQIYGTIDIKDLFAGTYYTTKRNKSTGTVKRRDSFTDIIIRKQIDKLAIINASSILPVDPQHQLQLLRKLFLCEAKFQQFAEFAPLAAATAHHTEDIDAILYREARHEDVKYTRSSFWSAKKLRLVHPIRKKFVFVIESNIHEITEDYYTTVKDAFLDYVLSDPHNRHILRIKERTLTFPVFVIRAPVSWHQSVLSGKNSMRHNLFPCHVILRQLTDLWFQKYETRRIIQTSCLKQRGLPMQLSELAITITEMCDQSRQLLLSDWLTQCVSLLMYHKSSWQMLLLPDQSSTLPQQAGKFFNAVYSLMSLQLRRFITNSLYDLLDFVFFYENGNKFEEYTDFYFLKKPFVTINTKTIDQPPYLLFSPSFDQFDLQIQNIFGTIVSVSENIPRIETSIFTDINLPNPYLRPVRATESHVQKILKNVLDVCMANSFGPTSYIEIYQPYFYYLSQEANNDLQLLIHTQPTPPLKIFIAKVKELISLQRKVTELRINVPFNMINLNCAQVNETVWKNIGNCHETITQYFLDVSKDHNERIMLKFEEIARRAGEIPESTKELVDLSNYITESKTIVLYDLKKQLSKSAEYIDFLMDYAEIPEDIIAINTKVFRWPKHLEQILELATSRINHKLEVVENVLRNKKSDFAITLIERAKQLDSIRKKDPPMLSINEMNEIVTTVDKFTSMLEQDMITAEDINTEEELLNTGTTSYQNLHDIITELKPFSEMWHTVYNFHVSYEEWYNCPYSRLNAELVKTTVEDMRDVLSRLLKIFYDVPGSKRVVEIVLTKVEKFYQNIPILETICNPGLQERHWKKIDELVAAEVKRSEDVTISEILNYGLNKYVDFLQNINVAASEEYTLEKSLLKMKDEWNNILIQYENYRDSQVQILSGIDDIQVMLDDYLLRIQAMRGSPFVGAIESDIETWEHKLILMQDVLDQWLQVQNTWLYLEPLFCSEDIMRQMPDESENFQKVNKIWSDITVYTTKNPNILVVIEYPNIMSTLKDCNSILEGIKKGLNNYLEKKRLVFPRFFFLSNRELLEILSESKDYSHIQSHLKCFEGISSLDITENYDIIGILSDQGENVPLNSAISPAEAKGIVERWLDQLEDSMIQSLCDINSKAVRSYSTTSLEKWIFQWPAMVAYCALYINWTTEVENAMKTDELNKCHSKFQEVLSELIRLCDTQLIARNRGTINTLIGLISYVVDVTKSLLKENIHDASSFGWIKQIRYYNEEQTTCIRVLRTTLTYGYEYLGNVTRLIMTPETERCYKLMSCCLEQSLFVCLMGPSGIGKTEICKDFSKAVAKPYCSFRCCENIGYKTISTFLKGCMQMGAWLCFDNIDRMKCEQLSIAAEEVRSIHLAIREKKTRFKFDGVEIPLNSTCNITFTFIQPDNFKKNIPDNLRKVLRLVIVPTQNYSHLIERILVSFGFKESTRWSGKILEIHNLANQLLWFEYHYKSDLRILKRILQHAEYLKNTTSLNEDRVIFQALRFVYLSKLKTEHRELLNNILHKTFADHQIPENTTQIYDEIKQLLESKNLVSTDLYVRKLLELYEAIQMHQGIILLGESFTGKTNAYQVLMDLMKNLGKEKVQHCVINQKSMNIEQLYGHLDSKTGEWSDGILSKTYQEYAESAVASPKWIIFDGSIDHVWIDRLTTVLDENKKLCLVSGEIIPMNQQMNIFFETDSLDYISPSIFCNCVIVNFDTEMINWRSLFTKFLTVLEKKLTQDHLETLRDIVEWIVPAVLEFLTDHAEQVIIVSKNYLFNHFTNMMTSVLESHNDSTISLLWIQSVLLFCVVWAFAGNISYDSKILFNTFYRNLLAGQIEKYPVPGKFKLAKNQLFPEKNTVFDWVCDKKSSGIWIPWINSIEITSMTTTKIDDLFIYTSDNAMQMYFLKLWFRNQQPSLLLGPAGNGKTATMLHYLSHLPADKYISNIINLSHYTSARNVQEMIMSKIDRRRKGVYGPSMGKKIILAFDDFERSVESESTENIVELLRQLLERKFWYDPEDTCRVELIDFVFTGAMAPPTNRSKSLFSRFIHHVNTIPSKPLNETIASSIFSGVLEKHLSNNGFSLQICQLSQAITIATLEVYRKAKQLVSSCKKIPSYFLDYKDIFRVFSGIGLMSAHKCQGVDELFRLWVHELMRVFGDKFETDVMREELLKSIKSSSCQHLRQRVEQYMSHLICPGQSSLRARDLRNLFFCNFVSHEHKYYDEVTNTTSLMSDLKNLVKEHAATYFIPQSCILFKYALECISSVVRAFQKDKGHVVMVGVNGSGRRTVLKLAAMVAQLTIYQIEPDSSYDIEQWQNELKQLLMTAGVSNKPYLFLLSDDELRDERYFDHINSIMSTGDISYIYSTEEKSSILNKMMDLAHEEGSKIDTAPATMCNYFIERLKRNLHIGIVMNPANPFYFNRLHMVPCILKCSSFIWSSSWPEDALEEFANELLKKTSLSEHPQLLKDGEKFCKIIHQSAINHTNRYNDQNKSNFYVSSNTYIKFLSTFRTLYKNKIEEISSKKNRYKQGLEKLNFTADQVVQMQNELQILKPKLLVTSDATEKLMIKIEQNTVNIETAKEIVAADEALANEAAAASQAIRDDCESDLSEAEPALFSATNALNTLKSSDITVIKAMKNPPSIVKLVLEAVCVMKAMKPELKTEVTGVTIEDYWPSSLKLLSDAKFLENLKYYDKENIDPDIMSTIRERYITHRDFDPDTVKKVSNACEGLCKWVRAMEIYDRVIKIVRPKKIKLAKAEEDYGLQMEKLNEKRAQLTEVLSKLQVLRDELAEKTKQKKELEDSIELCTLKLERAGKLIQSLSYEKMRWFELETELDKALVRSVGDIFLSSAFITYLSYFSSEFRKQIIHEWSDLCKEIKLPLSPEYTFSSNFIDSDDIRFWNMAKLSTDAASVDNYTIISKTIYLPVIIDPQGQAKNYIQYVENKNDLQIIKITDTNYVDNLKKAITNGQPVLLKDIPEKLDDTIDSLINFSTFKEEDVTYLKLNKENVPLNENFKIYITCWKRKPNFTPDINNKVTLINFEMTPEGLENCLLRVVISVDAPDLEEQNNNLLLQCAEDSRTLYQTEDKILNVLSSSIGNILEDETALQTLNDSKNLLEQIREKQKHSLAAEQSLKEAYKLYKIICKQVTSMYFGLQNLQQMNSLYCFSVDWFICLFQQAVKKSPKSQVMQQRINFVNKRFTSDLYREIDMCLEKKDMLPAAFSLALQMRPIQESSKKIIINDLSVSLCQSRLPIIGKGACEKSTWNIPPSFSDIDDRSLALEHLQCDYDLSYNEFKVLLDHLSNCDVMDQTLLDSLGTEFFIFKIHELVREAFQHNGESPPLNLYEIYHNTDVKLAIICGLTDIDVDPLIDIRNLASEMGLDEDIVKCVPFIETQIPSLLNSINEALTKGTWIVIQNCHLLKNYSSYLEFLTDYVFKSESVNPQFRLWMVTFPFNEFPSDVSSKGIKIMMKEASDLGSNIHHLYTYTSLMTPHLLESKKTVKNWQFILFFVYFCHSMLKLLWKTGLFGGNKNCSVTKINLHMMTSLVEILFSSDEQDFTKGFMYLSNECNYCAHLPDPEERLILSRVIESLKIENFSRPTAVSVCSKSFPVPEDISFNGCLRYAQSVKKTNLRQDFQLYHCSGLKRGWTFSNLWKMVRKLYFNLDSTSIVDESTVLNLINDILTVLGQFYRRLDNVKLSSGKDILNVFLKQEIKLYVRLLHFIFETLNRLKDVIFGKLPITEEYRKAFVVLQNNQLLDAWARASYPTSLSLLQYVVNLNQRLIFVNKWIHFGIPEVVWLPGLFNVRSFFISILYDYSSFRGICIKDVELHCNVTKFHHITLSTDEWTTYQREQKQKNHFGIHIHGLLLLGSSWNQDEMKLDYISERTYFEILPIIWIEPRIKLKKKAEDLYRCPLYYTNVSGDYLLDNYIISMNLPSLEDPIVLTQRGVKLVIL